MAEQSEQPVPNPAEIEPGLGRREFMRGAAATGIAVVGSGYLKPTLKLAGVTRLTSAASAPPTLVRGDDTREHRSISKHGDDGKD